MIRIKFQKSLYRDYFYYEVIPQIYNGLLNNEKDFCFDMSDSEFSNAEFLVEILCSASLIVNKEQESGVKSIPKFIIPNHFKLINYLNNVNYFNVANIPYNEVLSFNKILNNRSQNYNNKYQPQIFCISYQSGLKSHQDNVSNIIDNLINEELSINESGNTKYFIRNLERALLQLIDNFFEHNLFDNPYLCSCYYIAQKMPNNNIQIVFYDTGKGFRKRILELISQEKNKVASGNESTKEMNQYLEIENILLDNKLIWNKTTKNSNYQAINAALSFRKGSTIPGLAVIKEFALERGGSFFIHSGTASVYFDCNGKEIFDVYDENFSGVHFCIEIPLN